MSDMTIRSFDSEEAETISDFWWSLRDEFLLSEREKADEITELLFERGGVIGGFIDDELVGAAGYFFGEPSKDYANKEVGFIYIAGLDQSVRHTMAFRSGWRYLVEMMDGLGVTELRWHALESDDEMNQLYAQLGHHICAEPNRSGHACNLYGTTVESALAELNGDNA